MVDAAQGILGIEWIDGKSIRFLLGGGEEDVIVEEDDFTEEESGEDVEEEDPLSEYKVTKSAVYICRAHSSTLTAPTAEVMQMIGTELAKMHLADIIHGDLTTSNMMLRRPGPTEQAKLVSPKPQLFSR